MGGHIPAWHVPLPKCAHMHAYNINHHCNNQVEMLQVQSGIIPKDFSQNCGLSVYCKVGKPVIKGLTFMPSVLKSIFELLIYFFFFDIFQAFTSILDN